MQLLLSLTRCHVSGRAGVLRRATHQSIAMVAALVTGFNSATSFIILLHLLPTWASHLRPAGLSEKLNGCCSIRFATAWGRLRRAAKGLDRSGQTANLPAALRLASAGSQRFSDRPKHAPNSVAIKRTSKKPLFGE